MNKREIGSSGEEIAVHFLEGRGFRILQKNFRFGRGEIDLVAEEGETLVFVEVKFRRSLSHGLPEDSITPAKQRQIRRVAEGFLLVNRIDGRPCRLDVIAIEQRGAEVVVRHIPNAF